MFSRKVSVTSTEIRDYINSTALDDIADAKCGIKDPKDRNLAFAELLVEELDKAETFGLAFDYALLVREILTEPVFKRLKEHSTPVPSMEDIGLAINNKYSETASVLLQSYLHLPSDQSAFLLKLGKLIGLYLIEKLNSVHDSALWRRLTGMTEDDYQKSLAIFNACVDDFKKTDNQRLRLLDTRAASSSMVARPESSATSTGG